MRELLRLSRRAHRMVLEIPQENPASKSAMELLLARTSMKTELAVTLDLSGNDFGDLSRSWVPHTHRRVYSLSLGERMPELFNTKSSFTPLDFSVLPTDTLTPIDGASQARSFFTGQFEFDREALEADLAAAASGWDWSTGAYGHSLSLPEAFDVDIIGRTHHNNLPFANRLRSRCRYFKRIFDALARRTEVRSFRILRRASSSSYGFHSDRDKGEGVVRFQIPIVSNENVRIITTTSSFVNESESLFFRGQASEAVNRKKSALVRSVLWSELDRMIGADPNLVTANFPVGRISCFNTSRLHTLVNLGEEDRYALVIDVVVNDWVRATMAPCVE